MGPDTVRAQMNQWVPAMRDLAIAWLGQKDREARERADASSAEQMALARAASAAASTANALASRSADAAQTSNRIAAVALIVAIIAMVVSIIGLMHLVAHDDAPKPPTHEVTDAERHARFVALAREVEADESPGALDRALAKLNIRSSPLPGSREGRE